MDSSLITKIEEQCLEFLNKAQLNKLHNVLTEIFVLENGKHSSKEISDEKLISTFLSSKSIEGCSAKTIKYYFSTLSFIFSKIKKPIILVTTNDIRKFLSEYQKERSISKVTVDNVRRIASSFFSWLENEDYILKSPMRRIKKVKTTKVVREVYSDEQLETLRDHCNELRDLAIVDLLSSTGMRVGELVNLRRCDIDFQNRECIVLGKGGKERLVYFDARTKIHLTNYLTSREDNNPSLFVSLNKPHKSLQISGVESRLKKLGKEVNLDHVHPHKFRRTLATRAIDKGMPIEQVQVLLGHQKIDTTLEYAMVNQNNVKNSHRKYIG
jgi:site-specific recombinase XerD